MTPGAPTPGYPAEFGYDVIDVLGWGFDVYRDTPIESEGYDTVDWIEDLAHDLPTLCPVCGETWLMGPEAQAAGKCWRCRTNGVPHE
jgi:hypothetical protein